MSRPKIGFQGGMNGCMTGVGDWMRRLDAAGIPFCFKSVGSANVVEGQDLRKASGVPHVLVFRQAGPQWDVPDYSLTPLQAALNHWEKHVAAWPKELDPSVVWMETVNELDKNKADWIGEFCYHTAMRALASGRRWAGPSWSGGEPEAFHWWTEGMKRFVRLASVNPGKIAVSVHEYSFNLNNLIWSYPWLIGRFTDIHLLCDDLGIPAPTILVTELGWCYNDIPDQTVAMASIREVAALYDAYVVEGAFLWRLDGDDIKLAREVNALMTPIADYTEATEYGTTDPNPQPEPETIDLAQFVVGVPGVQHVLQCRFGDYFNGTQTLCTRDHGGGIFAQQKDRDQEIIYFDDRFVYRETDTSPGAHDGRPAYYCQYEGVYRGSYWCDRFVQVGDIFDRSPLIEHRYMDDCSMFASGVIPSQLRVAAYFSSYWFDEGLFFDAPVVELAWEIDGRVIERYLYGKGMGLVKWVEVERGWKSYLVEVHTDRPPMEAPAWPLCHALPENADLYYRPSLPTPPPVPPVDISLKAAVDAAVLAAHIDHGIQFNPAVGIQKRIVADWGVEVGIPIGEVYISYDGRQYACQSVEHLTTGKLYSYCWCERDGVISLGEIVRG